MDINELNKHQLILLTLLITFVVSIATGIVTVSLMNQMPKVVPQTINNVIQRTIERVSTVTESVPAKTDNSSSKENESSLLGDGNAIVSIYNIDDEISLNSSSNNGDSANSESTNTGPKPLGQGVIISEVGLILVDSNILNDKDIYKVILNGIDFDASVLKKFNNGFTVLKISEKTDKIETPQETNITNTETDKSTD